MASAPSREDFAVLIDEIEGQPGYRRPVSFGLGVATTAGDKVLDVRFLTVNFRENFGTAAVLARHLGEVATGHRILHRANINAVLDDLAAFRGEPGHANVEALDRLAQLPRPHVFPRHELQAIVVILMDTDDRPSTAADVYLRLHLLSLRLTPPRSLNFEGAFGKLNTKGPRLNYSRVVGCGCGGHEGGAGRVLLPCGAVAG